MMTAISVALVYFIRVPMFLPFLEYDPADIPIFITTFAFGPLAGFLLTVVVSVVQGLTVSAQSGGIGILMHILATGSFVLVAGSIYTRKRSLKGAFFALLCGTLIMTAAMTLFNILITPLYMNVPREQVLGLLLPAIVPFNLTKAAINSVVTFVLCQPLSPILRGQNKN